MLLKASLHSLLPLGLDYWIGLNDIVLDGVFVWQDSFEVADYTNWSVGEPNSEGGNCVFLVRESTLLWKPSSPAFGTICLIFKLF